MSLEDDRPVIHKEPRGNIVILRVEHGKVNALDTDFLRTLKKVLDDIHAAGEFGAVVLTGTESVFSAGVDLFKVLKGKREYLDEFLPTLTQGLSTLFTYPRPVVAAINGHAIAGGCVLACACDYRVMVDGESKVGVPELRVGVPFPGLALEIMRFAVPPQFLQEVLYLGQTYRPDDAFERGLIDEIVSSSALLDRACEVAGRLAGIPLRSFAITKGQLRLPTMDRLRRHESVTEPEVRDTWAAEEIHATIKAYLKKTVGSND